VAVQAGVVRAHGQTKGGFDGRFFEACQCYAIAPAVLQTPQTFSIGRRMRGLDDVRVETSIPGGAASLESILRTEELTKRPARPPDYERENSALVALVAALADSPGTILQTLAEKVLAVLRADSAGLSLLTKDGKRFYWAAIAGAWGPHIGGGTPRNFGPCGDVLDRDIPMLFTHWERRYPYLSEAVPFADEGLLVPFRVNAKAVGTIWAIAHDDRRKFDTEDLRLLQSMGRFASAAYQAVESLQNLKSEVAARERAEIEEALATARSELARATKLTTVAELSAAMAHEVNQPLAAIASSASACLRWLSAGQPNLERARLSAERVVRDADSASQIVNRVCRLFAHSPPEMIPLNVNEVVEEVGQLMLDEASGRSVSIETDLDRELPRVRADRVQIQQVIVNLARNGIEAMEATIDMPKVLSVRSKREGIHSIRVEVCDRGSGVQDPENVFKPFFTTKKTGMGMGLPICRSIIEAHQGKLWVTRNEGCGATFCFTLPVLSSNLQ
jgi:signal transduction histidine kinase